MKFQSQKTLDTPLQLKIKRDTLSYAEVTVTGKFNL